jgi:sulfopyruvate decarboxylase subunit beta
VLRIDRRRADPYGGRHRCSDGNCRGAGIEHAYTVRELDEFGRRRDEALKAEGLFVIVAKADRAVRRDIKRKHSDGREDNYIFVRHVETTEGVVIMGPSEHN